MDHDSGITDDWIFQHVVPNMLQHGIEPQVCKVLGRAMLWHLFDHSGDDCFPEHRCNQIMQAYRDRGFHNTLEDGCNPVKKRPLVVSGYDTEVMMDLLEEDFVGEGVSAVDTVRRSIAVRNQEVRLLSSQGIHL